MIRLIDGFHQDEQGAWVAELSCAHGQHIRHRPPWVEHPWVVNEGGRRSRIGTSVDCPLCDRAELPDGLHVVRVAGPFDETTLPGGLRRDHRVADRTWARVRVDRGAIGLAVQTCPPLVVRVEAGSSQPIPPTVPHALELVGPVELVVEFLVSGAHPPTG